MPIPEIPDWSSWFSTDDRFDRIDSRTSACKRCAAVVNDERQHVAWHLMVEKGEVA
jgi:hypothetical protein